MLCQFRTLSFQRGSLIRSVYALASLQHNLYSAAKWKHPKRSFLWRLLTALHCFWIISRPPHLTFQGSPYHHRQAFKSVVAHSSLHESSSFPAKHIYLSFLLTTGDFSALCFYGSSTAACWRKNTRPGVWRPGLNQFLHLKNGVIMLVAGSFLICSSSTWRNMLWDLLHVCVRGYAHVVHTWWEAMLLLQQEGVCPEDKYKE